MKIAYLRGTIIIIIIIMLSGQKKKTVRRRQIVRRPLPRLNTVNFIFIYKYVRQMEQGRKMNNETTPKLVKVYL